MPEDKHVVRILGSYSLLSFFTRKAQDKFFEITTSPEFEALFSFGGEYAKDTESFELDVAEKEFELRMTNLGFIREAFWKETFPPIFRYKNAQRLTGNWHQLLPGSPTQDKLTGILSNTNNPNFAEAFLYRYSLCKLGGELHKVRHGENNDEPNGELRIHVGLNKFGIANVGITITFERKEHEHFEDLCRRAYRKIAHLQEDPLKDLENAFGNLKTDEEVIDPLNSKHFPRLAVSYFQVLAITTIHQFLFEKLRSVATTATGYYPFSRGLKRRVLRLVKSWQNLSAVLANPWALSNEIPNSSRHGLPPLRHVVFIYQLVHPFHRKNSFLSQADNRRALLTLGHNVGWSPSWNRPFPLFDSNQDWLKDSSLLENSCCFIFPQGLVVVHPPNHVLYPGGDPENISSTDVPYRKYWELIFKLFIRVVEARLLMGMVNRYLSDIHKEFLEYSRMSLRLCSWWKRDKIHKQIVHVGRIIQRTSGRVITPEITRYSFVRKKLERFMESVNFEEHRGYIQSEYERLNQWVEDEKTTTAARVAILVAVLSLFVAMGSFGGDFFDFTFDLCYR